MTKCLCKFHLLQGACSSPVVLQRACSCPVVYRVTGCGACVPDAMQHGRSVLQPLVSLSRASAAAMMHCRSGTLTDLRRLVGACLKPALPKQNVDSAKVPDQRSTTTRRYRPSGFARVRAARRAAPHPGHTHHPRRPVETARSSYGRVPLELNGRVGTGALCAPCPPLATDRVGTGRGVKLAS